MFGVWQKVQNPIGMNNKAVPLQWPAMVFLNNLYSKIVTQAIKNVIIVVYM